VVEVLNKSELEVKNHQKEVGALNESHKAQISQLRSTIGKEISEEERKNN
jgi:hypothetical protein